MELTVPDNIKHKRIVVIDDQGSMRGVFNAFLRELGFTTVECIVDGVEGLKFMEGHAVDLVICDWNMPKLSGLEVLQTVRACEDTQTLPFVMVTSSSEIDRVKAAVESGVSDYLIKPFQPLHLGQKVIKVLSASDYKAKTFKRQRVIEEEETAEPVAEANESASTHTKPAGDDDSLMVDTILESSSEGASTEADTPEDLSEKTS